MSSLSTLPKGDSAWLLRKSIQRIMQQVSVLETNIGSSTTGNSADTQVIFNDAGTLRGDTGLTYDKSADRLSFGAGICYGLLTSASATITGDLTVRTNKLAVTSTGVGIGTATLFGDLSIQNGTNCRFELGSAAGGTVIENLNNARNAYLDMTMYADAYIWNRLGSEVMRLNSTGLGIGMGPANNLSIGSATYASFGVKIDSITQSSLIFKGTPDAVGYEHAKIVSGRESSPFTYGSFLAFYTEGKNSGTTDTSVERARFNSTGNLAFANGLGIDFSATTEGSGTMTSELLNDYEEGTFVPTIIGASTAGTGTYTNQVGRYVKIGSRVIVDVYLSWSAHTGTGAMAIAGLPYTIKNVSSYFPSVTFGYVNSISLTANNILTGYGTFGQTSLNLEQYPTGGGASAAVPVDAAGAISCSVSYEV